MKVNFKMTNEIKILPDFIANQIAAGEVVQKPESVVKELIENSIDAGATEIYLLIKKSGKELIHIIDNGDGMNIENLKLSIKRHATSKVFTQDDLEEIKSFGFRGEALASIAAVSKLEIRSKQIDNTLGWKLLSEPNSIPEFEEIDTSKGTQIFVKNLFYNVPARRKFLKANITEFRYISDTMIRFALSHPEIRFTFYDDTNLIFDLKKDTRENRIQELMGEHTWNNMFGISSDKGYIKFSGFVSSPNIARVSKANQYFFLNSRHIKSKSLSHAVFSAFGHLLEKNQQPVFIINIDIDYKKVDINVHPQKHEVKFEDEKTIYNYLKWAVQDAISERNLTEQYDKYSHSNYNKDQLNSTEPFFIDKSSGKDVLVNSLTGEIVENRNFSDNRQYPNQHATDRFGNNNYNESSFHNENKYNHENSKSAFDTLFSNQNSNENINKTSDNQEQSQSKLDLEQNNKTEFLQIHNKYILTQTENGYIIIDMHNAHERILYESAIEMMKNELKKSQKVLFPVSFKLNISEKSLLDEISDEIKNIGFEYELNDNEITFFGLPTDVEIGNEETYFRDLLEIYLEYKEVRQTDKRDNIAASYACRSAVKTGKKLTNEMMLALYRDLFRCNMPYVCPHGRPVVLEYSVPDLDKRFGRARDPNFVK